VKLLYDHNLSPKLVRRLADLFPDSNHVFELQLGEADDSVIWECAKAKGFIIASKDSDFSNRSLLFGHPPKVIRLHLGNCSTNAVEACFRSHYDHIAAFENDPRRGCLHLPPGPWV
jgi:predicted nuclease of predicted toxin-antitoxin system